MIPVDELYAQVSSYNPTSNRDLIYAAYEFGKAMHEGQYRHSGEPYFSHPIEVASILAQQKLDDSTIVTALLHDTVEDTRASSELVAERFGSEIADLVDGVTKLTKLQHSSKETKQAENFRKLLFAMSKDMRVILVKLADRLHNMRTIRAMRPEKQAQKANETMDIYAPLAGRMGMQWMRDELEDLSFGVINPDARASIMRRFVTLRSENGDIVGRITTDMTKELNKAGIRAQIQGRAKRPYSIWRKMQEKKQSFSRLSDIYGFRVITETEEDCYRALWAIHTRWRAVPGRFKDYISQPKSNGYRSIHTTVSGRDGKRVEVQIRTNDMHDVAESGVAAHWSYRDGVPTKNRFAVDPVRWVGQIIERLEGEHDHRSFLEAVKLEMYSDKVFCFSPKGDVIKLPKGATPIDFAYAIHTRIGNACVGAKIDGMRAPLTNRLKNGQSVEIVTAEGQEPQSHWLDYVETGKAKTAIKRYLLDADRSRKASLGRAVARAAFEHIDKEPTTKGLVAAAEQLGFASVDEMYMRLATGQLSGHDIVSQIYPGTKRKSGTFIEKGRAVIGLQPGQKLVRGACCAPLPGERIVGITMPEEGVVIHGIDCKTLVAFEQAPERWIDLHWREGDHLPEYSAQIVLTLGNDAGALGRVCSLIGESGANITDIEFTDRQPDFYKLKVFLELRHIEQLHAIISSVKAQDDVEEVSRFRADSAIGAAQEH